MKPFLRLLCGSFCVSLLMLATLFLPSVASASSASPAFRLPNSPLSTSFLMAQAIHQGKIQASSHGTNSTASPNLTCSPTPCALPNKEASGGNGTNIVNEDPIAVNPTNNKQLLSGGNDYNCSSLQGFYSSSNGGKTWKSTCMGSLSGDSGDGDPGVGYDLNGNSYISGIDTGSNTAIVFEKSSNNGTSWSAPAAAVSPVFSGGLTDKDWLQIDDNASSPHANALYISVTQFDSSQTHTEISVSHSDNGGSTWTTKVVDTEQSSPNIDQFSDLAVGKDGTVYVSWMRCTANGPTGDCGGTTATFWISKSTNGGNTWSTPSQIGSAALAPDNCGCYYGGLPNTNERVSDIPAIGIDNSTGSHHGNLYAVLYNWTGTHMEVEVTTSTNGGTSWGTPVLVAPASETHDQFFPWLSVSPKNGAVGVSWLDRRNDPNNLSYETFATVSTNGGTSFATDIQIASVPSNPDHDGFNGGFMGDYTGNVWAGKKLMISWMDTRNGTDCQDWVGGYFN
jgi:hypothetical protein